MYIKLAVMISLLCHQDFVSCWILANQMTEFENKQPPKKKYIYTTMHQLSIGMSILFMLTLLISFFNTRCRKKSLCPFKMRFC